MQHILVFLWEFETQASNGCGASSQLEKKEKEGKEERVLLSCSPNCYNTVIKKRLILGGCGDGSVSRNI